MYLLPIVKVMWTVGWRGQWWSSDPRLDVNSTIPKGSLPGLYTKVATHDAMMIERKSLRLAWNRIGSSDSDTYIFSWPVRILERMSRKYQNIRCALYFHFYTVKCERNIRNVVRSRWVTTVLLSFKICRKMSPFVYKHVFHSQRKSTDLPLLWNEATK